MKHAQPPKQSDFANVEDYLLALVEWNEKLIQRCERETDRLTSDSLSKEIKQHEKQVKDLVNQFWKDEAAKRRSILNDPPPIAKTKTVQYRDLVKAAFFPDPDTDQHEIARATKALIKARNKAGLQARKGRTRGLDIKKYLFIDYGKYLPFGVSMR